MRSTFATAASAAALAAVVGLGDARAQASPDWAATPLFGTMRLSAGFFPDPRTATLQAGGPDDAASLGSGCVGYVDFSAPDVTVEYEAGGFDLGFLVRADADTTLVVRTPDGRWLCVDDADGLDPALSVEDPPSGPYAVWVGTWEPGGLRPATLSVTEGGVPGAAVGGAAAAGAEPDWAAAPARGRLSLSAGFPDDPRRVGMRAGGDFDASVLGSACAGWISGGGPDVVLDYEAGDLPLRVYVESGADTTLAVRTPSGEWACNDDDQGLDPGLVFRRPESGAYAVFVGTFDRGGEPEATLLFSEFAPDHGDVSTGGLDLGWDAAPTYGTLRLSAGFDDDPRTVEIRAGGGDDASGLDGVCNGWIAAGAPDVVVDYAAGGFPLNLYVRSEADTTLVVRSPSGEILCDDDTDDTNPAVLVEDPESGAYAVWVGTFSEGPTQDATLFVSELATRTGAGGEPDWRAAPTYGTIDLAAGFTPDPRTVAVRAGGGGSASGLGDGCAGEIDFSAPDVDLNWSGGGDVLYISATSDADTTLVVYTPSLEWICNDDFDGTDPGIVLRRPQAGNYNIWVGTFSGGPTQPATLRISGRDPLRK